VVVSVQGQVHPDERGVVPGRTRQVAETPDQDGGNRPAQLTLRELRVVLERPGSVPGQLGQRNPQLDALQPAAVVAGGLLRVAHRVARGHQVELAGLDDLLGAEAVAVEHLTVREPGDGLQADMRVRSDIQATVLGDVGRAHVVGEAPGADGTPALPGQGSPHPNIADALVAALADLQARRCRTAAVSDRGCGVDHADRSAHHSTWWPYISPSGSAISSMRAPSGSVK
jgi:hypothetical protein